MAASRVRSSCAWAMRPGRREMRNTALPSSYANPRSAVTAAMAPSTLTGSGWANSAARAIEHVLDRANQADVLALELELERHLEQPRRARVARVGPVAEARRIFLLLDAFLDESLGRLLQRPSGPHLGQARVQKPHARLDVAAVVRAEREDAGRHAVLERGPGRGDGARGEGRGRRHAVIDRRHQNRREHASDRRRRQLAHQQQVGGFGERQPAHHLVERVAPHEDLVGLDRRQRCLPAHGRETSHSRAVQPIAEVAEAGHDVFLRVQALGRPPA